MLLHAVQVVAVKGPKLLSVFDGATEYQLGKWTYSRHGAASYPPVYACFYGFATPEEVSSWWWWMQPGLSSRVCVHNAHTLGRLAGCAHVKARGGGVRTFTHSQASTVGHHPRLEGLCRVHAGSCLAGGV